VTLAVDCTAGQELLVEMFHGVSEMIRGYGPDRHTTAETRF